MTPKITSMTFSTAPARPKPKAGDTKTIRGVLHVRKQSRVEVGPHRGALVMSYGRPVYEWVPVTNNESTQ